MSHREPLYECVLPWQVSKWVHNSDTNHGLLLVTSLPSGRWFEPVPPTQGGGDGDADADADVSAHLVVYSDDGKRASISDSSPHNGKRFLCNEVTPFQSMRKGGVITVLYVRV